MHRTFAEVKNAASTCGNGYVPVVEASGANVNLAALAAANRGYFNQRLSEDGAILFRGFEVCVPAALREFATAMSGTLYEDSGEHPREGYGDGIYTPVFYPSEQRLLWHNENSFNDSWPLKIWFACAEKPPVGGESLLVNSRSVYERLEPSIRQRFVEKGVLYVRNHSSGLGLDWRTVFRTSDRDVVEETCRRNNIKWEWTGEDGLRTWAMRPAVVSHPVTAEIAWFNQAQHWHVSCLPAEIRTMLMESLAEEEVPRNCYYGDGSVIEDTVMTTIRETYRSLEVVLPLQVGDVVMIDNVLTAHGRNPYKGKRRLLVAMAELHQYGPAPSRVAAE